MPVLAALLLVCVVPSDAWAWAPGTHVLLGEAVLRNASLLPAAVAALITTHRDAFLYGSIAADTSMAKRYAAFGRHCHAWHVGMEILDRARSDALRAFGYGYLSHLAADVIAHNHFVPYQLAVTASTATLGHGYWEARFEAQCGERSGIRARELIRADHALADRHLDAILSPTLFSTATNRRFFRGMVYVSDTPSWQRAMTLLAERSRWELAPLTMQLQLAWAYDYVMDLLIRGDASEPFARDASGEVALREAKQMRRAALRRGARDAITNEAEARFGLRPVGLGFASALPDPLYPAAARSASN